MTIIDNPRTEAIEAPEVTALRESLERLVAEDERDGHVRRPHAVTSAATFLPPPQPSALPTLNVDLLTTLLMWAEHDKGWGVDLFDYLGETAWDQDMWAMAPSTSVNTHDFLHGFVKADVCGSAHCQAGGAVVENDYRLIVEANGLADYCVPIRWTGEYDKKGRKVYDDVPDMIPETIPSVARRLLGLTNVESEQYFAGSNTLYDLKRFANDFARKRGLDPITYNVDGSVCTWDDEDPDN